MASEMASRCLQRLIADSTFESVYQMASYANRNSAMACGKISGLFGRDKQYDLVQKWSYRMPYMITALPHGGARCLKHCSCKLAVHVSLLVVVIEPSQIDVRQVFIEKGWERRARSTDAIFALA